jgi:type I restriction enzyme R subunit
MYPSYREELISQIAASQLLVTMGYQYLTPDQALRLRGGRERNVALTGVLVNWLKCRRHSSIIPSSMNSAI